MKTLTWEVFETYLHIKTPSALSMGGTRDVRIGFNPTSQNMFIRLPIDAISTVPPSPYSEILVEVLKDETGFVLEIKTATSRLFREFHRFAEIITEDFEQPGKNAFGAFETAVIRWRELISRKDLLTDEQRLGLQGEIVFLRALINVYGIQSVFAWTGRNQSMPERHDFRIEDMDIEIKSTRGTRRIHIIHGLKQLQPSMGRTLYLLSIKFQDAGLGNGRNLCDEIEDVRLRLGNNTEERTEFEGRLLTAGYRDSDAEHYWEKFVFADPPVLIPVDDKCPKITMETISIATPPELSGRIDDVSYRLNFEGLGIAQGSEEYVRIFGKIQLEA